MNFLPAVLSAIIAFVATISAGFFIKKFKNNIGIICAFSAGFFISLAVFDLLPDVLSLAPNAQISTNQLFLSGVAGFVFLFALNFGFSRFHMKNHTIKNISPNPRIGLLATLEFCSHGFLEGLAIGLSFQIQFSLGVVVAIVVISHGFCDGISTLTLMLNSGNTMKSSLSLLFVEAIAPVMGVGTTLFVAIQDHF